MAVDPWSHAAKTRSEHAEQTALFMWSAMAMNFGTTAAMCVSSYTIKGAAEALKGNPVPELKWLHAISNHGKGFGRAAEGVKAGVFDLFLPVPIRKFRSDRSVWFDCHGFYIELKRLASFNKKEGIASAKQLEFRADIMQAGYKAEVIYGWEDARDNILRYLGRLPDGERL